MNMCSEPSVQLTTQLYAHVRHSSHCTFTWALVNQETKKPETKGNEISRLKGHGETVHAHLV